jgi:hypothetical protein
VLLFLTVHYAGAVVSIGQPCMHCRPGANARSSGYLHMQAGGRAGGAGCVVCACAGLALCFLEVGAS